MIVVTGGTGLVGGHLLLELLNQNEPVRVLVRKGSDAVKVLAVWKHYLPDPHTMLERFTWHAVDLHNRSEIIEAIDGATQLYHCAGLVSFNTGQRRALWETNVGITADLVNACLDLRGVKMIYVSSIAAVNSPGNDMISDEISGWPARSRSMYARTKTCGEFEVWRGISEGLNAVIVNPSVILGPGAWEKSSVRIFDLIYRRLRYYTLGVTGFVDVRDVAQAMVKLMSSPVTGERFILSAADMSYRELFEKIASAFDLKAPSRYASPLLTSLAWKFERIKSLFTGSEPRITRTSSRSSHAKQRYSSDKIRTQLNFSFKAIDETIRDVAAFYIKDRLNNRKHSKLMH